MLYLSGCIVNNLPERCGYMLTPMMGNNPDRSTRLWGADTGCFAAPEKHDDGKYLAWLQRMTPHNNLFATAPDVVGDWAATWERAEPMLERIRALGFKAAIVLQDGADRLEWDRFDVVFVGGTTAWKWGFDGARLCAETKARGKWLHIGRVNSRTALRRAERFGADSTDGTFLRFGPQTNIPRLEAWFDLAPAPLLKRGA